MPFVTLVVVVVLSSIESATRGASCLGTRGAPSSLPNVPRDADVEDRVSHGPVVHFVSGVQEVILVSVVGVREGVQKS